MSRPRKVDALTPAERARRYRLRLAGAVCVQAARVVTDCVTEIVTETVTETPVSFVTLTVLRRVTETVTETDWPFPGSLGWFEKYGFVRAHPSAC